MALLDCESFGLSTNPSDYTSSGAWLSLSGTIMNDANSPFLNEPYFANNPQAASKKVLPVAVKTFFAGARINCAASAGAYYGSGAQMGFLAPNADLCFTVHCSVNRGQIYVTDSGGNELGASLAGVFPATGWFYLEVGATVGQTTGSVTVLVNGSEVLTLSGINTQGQGNGTVQQYGPSSGNNEFCWSTHYYFCDGTGTSPQNTFLGDVRVQCLRPISNAEVTFTPNGDAANYENVSMAAPNPASDFNSSTTVGNADIFNFQPVAGGLISIMGVAVKAVATKSDAGLRQMSTYLNSNGATSAGTPVNLGTTLTLMSEIVQNDPHSGAQWTQQGVDALTAGYQITG